MQTFHAHADPPRTLADRLHQLNDNLHGLSERLKSSIASVIGTAIADAVRDAVQRLLGIEESPAVDYRYEPTPRSRWDDRNTSGRWDDRNSPDHSWNEDSVWDDRAEFDTPTRRTAPVPEAANRWRNAWTSALQTALWWLKHQPGRRPVLTTAAVTLAAGVTAFVAGPALAAGVGVLASVASLLFTADGAKSAAELVSGRFICTFL